MAIIRAQNVKITYNGQDITDNVSGIEFKPAVPELDGDHSEFGFDHEPGAPISMSAMLEGITVTCRFRRTLENMIFLRDFTGHNPPC